MKKRVLTIALCVATCMATAQQLPPRPTIDFLNSGSFRKYTKVKYGDKIVVTIKNVNKNLYTINDSLTQTNFNTDLPDIFQGIKLPGYLALTLPDGPKSKTSIAPPDAVVGMKSSIEAELDIINASSIYINGATNYNNNLASLYQSCGKDFGSIEKELIQITNGYLPSPVGSRAAQVTGIQHTLEKAISDAIQAKAHIESILPHYLTTIDAASQNLKNNIIWKHENYPTPKTSRNAYRQELIDVRDAKHNLEAYAAHKDSLLAIIKAAFEQVTAIEKFRDDNRIQILTNNYELINENNFSYTSDTIVVKKDELKLNIRIKAAKALACAGPERLVIEQTYRTVGGWKVDFSTGIFVNVGNEDFLGREIQYKSAPDSTISIESKDGGDRALLSIGALMHVYRRSGNNINWAISPGLSTSTAFDGLNFHLGGSFLYGKEDRLVLTIGLTLRESRILDRNYSFGKVYQKSELPETPPTIKVFPKPGGVVSLTYNWKVLRKK